MPDMSFGAFLNKMTGETNPNRKPKNKIESQEPKKKKLLYEEEEKKPEKNEQPKQKKENDMPSNNTSNDDIVVKALDYSTRFLKVIYDNFKNEKDRKIVLQSIRSAIDLALGDQTSQQSTFVQPKPKKPEQQTQSTNENVEVHMNDLSGQEVNIDPKQYYQTEEHDGIYKKRLNLGLKVNNDGKQEVDLSQISQQDIYEMRVLAGVDEDQKKREQKNQIFNPSEIEE